VRSVVAVVCVLVAGCTSVAEQSSAPATVGLPSAPAAESPSAPVVRPAVLRSDARMEPLHGAPLALPTGLRFLVTGSPPVVLDIDRGTTRPVTGLPAGTDRYVHVVRVDGGAVITSGCVGCAPSVYALPAGSFVARRIAAGSAEAATADGRGVWLRTERAGRCTLGAIGFDGARRTAARVVSCAVWPRFDTPAGLVVSRVGGAEFDAVLAHGSLRPLHKADRILQVLGTRVLTSSAADEVLVTDLRTRATRPLPRTGSPGTASQALPSPDGRWVAVSFESPAWPGPRQLMDVWLLDTRTLRWRHLPSMPVPTSLKGTGLSWTDDGRLAILGIFDATPDPDMAETFTALATWHPATPHLSLHRLPLPTTGTDHFHPWP
jgi:hypothetical protein